MDVVGTSLLQHPASVNSATPCKHAPVCQVWHSWVTSNKLKIKDALVLLHCALCITLALLPYCDDSRCAPTAKTHLSCMNSSQASGHLSLTEAAYAAGQFLNISHWLKQPCLLTISLPEMIMRVVGAKYKCFIIFPGWLRVFAILCVSGLHSIALLGLKIKMMENTDQPVQTSRRAVGNQTETAWKRINLWVLTAKSLSAAYMLGLCRTR